MKTTTCADCAGAGMVPAQGWEPAEWVTDGYVTCPTCDTRPQHDICAVCRADITRFGDGLWFGAAVGGNYNCRGGLHAPVARCTDATGHLNGSDHRWQDCPTYADSAS